MPTPQQRREWRRQQRNRRRLRRTLYAYYAAKSASYFPTFADVMLRIGLRSGSRESYVPPVITTTPLDFIAEVDITLRRVLSRAEHEMVHNRVIAEGGFGTKLPPELVVRLGEALAARGIYPPWRYFMPIDRRLSKEDTRKLERELDRCVAEEETDDDE